MALVNLIAMSISVYKVIKYLVCIRWVDISDKTVSADLCMKISQTTKEKVLANVFIYIRFSEPLNNLLIKVATIKHHHQFTKEKDTEKTRDLPKITQPKLKP